MGEEDGNVGRTGTRRLPSLALEGVIRVVTTAVGEYEGWRLVVVPAVGGGRGEYMM